MQPSLQDPDQWFMCSQSTTALNFNAKCYTPTPVTAAEKFVADTSDACAARRCHVNRGHGHDVAHVYRCNMHVLASKLGP
jgi:hypothetical protein